MAKIQKHQNGEVSIRMSKDLAQRIAVAMDGVYKECDKWDKFLADHGFNAVNAGNQASSLHSQLNAKVWR